jgi:ribonuclease BN (tRNA processing enzyme)
VAGTSAVFLGTGNFLTPGRRYWNSFVLDGRVLVEPSPIALPHLRRVGIDVAAIDVVAISHFHPDHTFGWPFLALELLRTHADRPLHIVGPPGVRAFLTAMLELGGIPDVLAAFEERVDARYVEVDEGWQEAGSLRFRAVRVEHVPHLECFGFLFELDGRTIGYSGDSKPCAGIEDLVVASDVLVLECNGPHAPGADVAHHDQSDVEALRARHPDLPFVLTHLGAEPDLTRLPNTRVPTDLESLEL